MSRLEAAPTHQEPTKAHVEYEEDGDDFIIRFVDGVKIMSEAPLVPSGNNGNWETPMTAQAHRFNITRHDGRKCSIGVGGSRGGKLDFFTATTEA